MYNSVPSHFIHPALHFLRHFIPKGKIVTSYQALHTSALHTMRHFISKSLHTSALHTKATSYRCTSYQGHFIPVTSYRGHFIPKSNQSLRTNALHTSAIHTSHFMPVTLYQSLYPCAFHISALRTEFTLLSSYLIECTSD